MGGVASDAAETTSARSVTVSPLRKSCMGSLLVFRYHHDVVAGMTLDIEARAHDELVEEDKIGPASRGISCSLNL